MKTRYTQDDLVKLVLRHSKKDETEESISEEEISQLKKLLFLNNYTLQLTTRGVAIFSNLFESHTIEAPEGYILKNKDIITLDRECFLPYYYKSSSTNIVGHRGVNKPYLIVFERELALILKLYDFNLDMIRDMPRDGFFE